MAGTSVATWATPLRQTDVLLQAVSVINALEELSHAGIERRADYLPYRVSRLRHPRILKSRLASALFSPRAEVATSVCKLVSAPVLLVIDPKSPSARLLRLLQLLLHAFNHVRVAGLGQDGSDHALTIMYCAQLVASSSRRGGAAERAAITFVAAQGLLSYFVSGVAKLVSPVWRAGTAMQGIARATSYGDPDLYKLMRTYPLLAKITAWSTIIGETMAPLVFLAPTPVRWIWQISMLAMHLGIGRYMGLNRFMWAFAAFHPAISSVTEATRRSTGWMSPGGRRT
jgi:hypothetical protein